MKNTQQGFLSKAKQKYKVLALLLMVCAMGVMQGQTPLSVTNPSFEELATPGDYPNNYGQTHKALDWVAPTSPGYADYSYNGHFTVGIRPLKSSGTYTNVLPHDGNAFMSIIVEGKFSADVSNSYNNNKSYITTQLTSPMVAGVTYTITFYTMHWYGYPIWNETSPSRSHFTDLLPAERGFLGACFSPVPPTVADTNPNQANNQSKSSIVDTWYPENRVLIPASNNDVYDAPSRNTWVPVTLSYTAKGGEEYMTIGQFRDADTSMPFDTNPSTRYIETIYYAFDGMSVTQESIPLTNTCPATTVDLTALHTATPPVDTSVVWFDGIDPLTATQVTDPAAVGAGTYYAFYYSSANGGCYSPASIPVEVTIIDCTDTDGDGVLDIYDLDKDNDGILDIDECPSINYKPLYHLFDLYPADPTNSLWLFKQENGIGTDFVCPAGSGCPLTINPGGEPYTVANNVTGVVQNLAYDDGSFYTITETGDLLYTNDITTGNFTNLGYANISYAFKNLGYDNGVFYHWYENSGALTLYSSNDPTVGWTSMGALPGLNFSFVESGRTYNLVDMAVNDGVFYFMYYSAQGTNATNFTRVFSTTTPQTGGYTNEGPAGFGGSVKNIAYGSEDILTVCDTDGDGIPNYLDLDSDNDGCLDALEGDENVTVADLVDAAAGLEVGMGSTADNKNLCADASCVDADGVPLIVNSGGSADIGDDQGQGAGFSQSELMNACDENTGDCEIPGATGTPLESKFGILTKANKASTWPESVPNGYLVLDGAEKGFVVTHMTNDQRDALVPVEGMMIYNTTVNCVQLYRGTTPGVDTGRTGWNCIESGCDGVISPRNVKVGYWGSGGHNFYSNHGAFKSQLENTANYGASGTFKGISGWDWINANSDINATAAAFSAAQLKAKYDMIVTGWQEMSAASATKIKEYTDLGGVVFVLMDAGEGINLNQAFGGGTIGGGVNGNQKARSIPNQITNGVFGIGGGATLYGMNESSRPAVTNIPPNSFIVSYLNTSGATVSTINDNGTEFAGVYITGEKGRAIFVYDEGIFRHYSVTGTPIDTPQEIFIHNLMAYALQKIGFSAE